MPSNPTRTARTLLCTVAIAASLALCCCVEYPDRSSATDRPGAAEDAAPYLEAAWVDSTAPDGSDLDNPHLYVLLVGDGDDCATDALPSGLLEGGWLAEWWAGCPVEGHELVVELHAVGRSQPLASWVVRTGDGSVRLDYYAGTQQEAAWLEGRF